MCEGVVGEGGGYFLSLNIINLSLIQSWLMGRNGSIKSASS